MSATSSTPRLRGASQRRRRAWRWLAIPVGIVLALGGYVLWQRAGSNSTTTTTSTVTVSRGTLTASVSGSGTVAATASRALSFPVAGTVSEVLVAVGDVVSAGQPLARLDPTTLNLALQQAEANLVSAQAQVAAANGAGATPEDLAQAQAQLASAQAQYSQTVKGSTTAAQLASAQAQLASAQAQLEALLAGPTAAELAAAQANVDQARLSLEAQRASLSTAKTRAESQVVTAANSLRDAQDSYATIYWQNRKLEDSRSGLSQADQDNEVAAQRAVANAEESLRQAQLSYEQAHQDELIGIQQAEAELSAAQRDLATLQEGATATELASARASVASAQSSLDALQQGATAEEREIAQASLDQSRINLEQLSAPAAATSQASAAASLAQAEAALAQARQDLADATLLAPFDGVVAEVLLSAGETASAATTLTVLDPSRLYVELSLSESDVAAVSVGQAVQISLDALPDAAITGAVTAVAPAATVTSNVATYPVRVSFEPGDQPIRVGMSASGTITTAEHADALIVPSRAVQTQGDVSVVQVRQNESQPPMPVRVTTGLISNGQTEIVSCVDTGDLCLQAGDTLVVTTAEVTASTTTQRNNGGIGGFGGGMPPGMGR